MERQSQLERLLKMAELEAERDQSGVVGIEHVAIGAFQEGGNFLSELFKLHGITLEQLRARNVQQANEPPKP